MKKRFLFFLFTVLMVLAQANIASATSANGYQPEVPKSLKN